MFFWLQTATLHMHFMPLHSLGNLEISTISQVHCQLFETKQLASEWITKFLKLDSKNCIVRLHGSTLLCLSHQTGSVYKSEIISKEPILQMPPCNTEGQAGWFSASSHTPRTSHVAAGASPITVPVRRVAEKNPFHWRVGSVALLVRKMCSCQSSVQGESENQMGIVDVLLIQKGTYETMDLSEISLSLCAFLPRQIYF